MGVATLMRVGIGCRDCWHRVLSMQIVLSVASPGAVAAAELVALRAEYRDKLPIPPLLLTLQEKPQ